MIRRLTNLISSRRRIWPAAAVVLLIPPALVALWWVNPPDPVAVLQVHAAGFSHLVRSPAPELGAAIERWTIVDARGDTTTALWRAAAVVPGTTRSGAPIPTWTVVLLGGLRTGEKAALLLPADVAVHILALDWPWTGPTRMRTVELLRRLPAIQRGVLRSPGTIALGLAATASASEVDPQRIAVVGTSLGVPPSVAVARLTTTPRALVLLHGAADIGPMLENSLRAHVRPRFARRGAAALAVRLVGPLEPSLHAETWRGRPVLLVNARRDERLPATAIAALHKAFPWAERRWLDSGHVRPRADTELTALARETASWLTALDSEPTPSR